MLHHLGVRNLGVLDDASIQPSPRFTVISGETGTGKTLLLGALRLLVGDKPDSTLVGPFGAEARADALFELDGEEVGVSRVVPRTGRSRGYIEGAVASSVALAERVGGMVEIVGQHDQVGLRRPSELLNLLDSSMGTAGRRAIEAYASAWVTHKRLLEERDALGGDALALERELDLLRHQLDEIDRAALTIGDDEAAKAMASRLRNATVIREELGRVVEALEDMDDRAGAVVAGMRRIADVDPTGADQVKEAETLAHGTSDLLRQMRAMADSDLEDPEALASAEARLNQLGDLKRKYGRSVADILEFAAATRDEAERLADRIERAGSIDAEITSARTDLALAASELSSQRRAWAGRVEDEARRHLADLGLGDATFVIDFTTTEPGPGGSDRVTLMFASDPRLDPGPIQKVASGGELSRLVLAIRLAAAGSRTATLVFDEVDSGVGGAIALALGRKLADLGESAQVLCVTHLPQIAAQADVHYAVTRDGATAKVARVEGESRVDELTRMLAGLPESLRGREAAAELLELARS